MGKEEGGRERERKTISKRKRYNNKRTLYKIKSCPHISGIDDGKRQSRKIIPSNSN
jgi:hypothetical protein